jgi:hypothetical protein
MLEKPPEEKETATSGSTGVVPPTAVTQGQVVGKAGWSFVRLCPSFERQKSPVPESPEEKRMDFPRAPS